MPPGSGPRSQNVLICNTETFVPCGSIKKSLGTVAWRSRPGTYTPDNIPARVLPKVKKRKTD